MRRVIVVLIVGAIGALNAGCLAVVANKGYASEHERVVVKDGEFYVVNLKDHTARRIEIREVEASVTMEEIDDADDD